MTYAPQNDHISISPDSHQHRQDGSMIENVRQALKSEQLRGESVIAALSDGVAIIDKSGIAIHANQAYLDMLALKSEEFIGKQSAEIISHRIRIVESTSATPRLSKNVAEVFRTGEPITIDVITVEYADGRDVADFSVSISPLTSDDGEITAVMMVGRNITSLMQLQRAKDKLIATASHELRTPITVIAGYIDLLLSTTAESLNDKQLHYLRRTKETAAHLTEMVNDMLEMSRLDSGQRDDNRVSFNASNLLRIITERHLSQFAQKHLALHIDAPQSIRVYADQSRLEEVAQHLLGNALKFTPEGGKITISTKKLGSMCEISIIDTGPGIPEEHLSDIFDRFTKLDESGGQPGAGLGLTIAKNIVENWGGTIAAENQQGGGARFYFTVPIATVEDTM